MKCRIKLSALNETLLIGNLKENCSGWMWKNRKLIIGEGQENGIFWLFWCNKIPIIGCKTLLLMTRVQNKEGWELERSNQLSCFGETHVWKPSWLDIVIFCYFLVLKPIGCRNENKSWLKPLLDNEWHFYNCGLVEINQTCTCGENWVWK